MNECRCNSEMLTTLIKTGNLIEGETMSKVCLLKAPTKVI